jgi:hypothetical protein
MRPKILAVNRFSLKYLLACIALSPALVTVPLVAQGQAVRSPSPTQDRGQISDQQTSASLPLFYQKLELLDTKKHKSLAVAKDGSDLSFAGKANVIPIVITELSLASKHYPLVFIAEGSAPAPTLVALVSLGDNQNLFVDSKGKWRTGSYVPAWVRRYPFLTVKAEQNRDAIAFDPTSKLFSGKNNLPLFDNDQPTETLKRIVAFQNEFNVAIEQTTIMVKALQDAGILEPATLTIGSNEKDKPGRSITGFLVVNEAKLRALDSAAVTKLHQANAFGLAYAQLLSMVNLQTMNAAK